MMKAMDLETIVERDVEILTATVACDLPDEIRRCCQAAQAELLAALGLAKRLRIERGEDAEDAVRSHRVMS